MPETEPKLYSEEDVLALVRRNRNGRKHPAEAAWCAIKRCRGADTVRHLQFCLVEIANAPHHATPARGEMNHREMSRYVEQIEWTANVIDRIMRQPSFEMAERVTKFHGRFGNKFFGRPVWWEEFPHDESQVLVPRESGDWDTIATDATPFYGLPRRLREFANLLKSYNLGRRARLTVAQRVAYYTGLFVIDLQNTGPRHLREAAEVLKPIYEAIRRPKPTYRALYDTVRRLPADHPRRSFTPNARARYAGPVINYLCFYDHDPEPSAHRK
jgi:hypothetical protein